MTALASSAPRDRDELIDRARRAESVRVLFDVAAPRLRRLVPYDAAGWMATDPATSLPAAPTRTENMRHISGEDVCLRLWELEFLVEDVNLYGDLARSPLPAAGLRQATDGRPARSVRYREHLRPNGFGDELRAVLRADGSAWAWITLLRADDTPPFGAGEAELVASLSAPLAAAIRDHARPTAKRDERVADHGPGLMLFDRAGELFSVNDDALAWLDELAVDSEGRVAFGIELPLVVLSTLARARAIAAERDHGIARVRIRSASGRWLVCHASCMRDPDGMTGETALVIEPATAAEIAPIIVDAYELSSREQQITQLIAQGFGTGEIAARLHLSAHTVRDYVKTVFDKVAVSSRGELVATLFAEHYAPIHLDPKGVDRVDG